jgi:hypothetical protein
VSDPIRTARRKPAATMTGPEINSHRGPTLAANAPAAGDAKAITSGRGSSAAPACVAVYPPALGLSPEKKSDARPGVPVLVEVAK